jgi:DNA-binding SARP family transcriptional activator/basic membrane lipoprotein Med (substrate-binding protein (PBP1-ABC) superfamily)
MQAARSPLDRACRGLAPRSNALSLAPRRWFATGVTNPGMSFHVLGPLEVCLEGEELVIGGAKQRAVLAALLLRAGEVVPVGRLIDELWGDEPPPSAAHTLESYVSRLRQLFNGHGPRLVRRGAGYAIELGDAKLDARGFVELQERASLAAAMEDHVEVVELTAEALALWRGPALADVALASAGRAEADRLEELRLRTYELRFDAELALGGHEQAVGELRALVAQSPYRERFVAQLMLALYRAGRHAEALDVYEQTRRRLGEDLGLQPSADLQQLSGQIVRQDPALRRPTLPATAFTRPSPARQNTRRAAVLAATGAAVASALALTASGGAAVPDRVPPSAKSLALVLPGSKDRLGFAATRVSTAVDSSEILYTPETQTAFVDPNTPQADITAVVARIRKGGVGLVVALGDGPSARALAGVVRTLPETKFVFIDASVSELSLEGVPNAAAIRFSDEDALYLGGYLAGLVPTMDGSKRRVDAVSVVAGSPTRDTARLIAGFKRGLRASRPGVPVRVDYSRELEDVTACEHLANRQIDAGSDIVLALAGRCSLGALAVARTRGVWGAGAEEDGINLTDHVLTATQKEWTTATLLAIERLQAGTLAMGRDTVLGFEDEYMVKIWWSNRAPEQAASNVIDRCSEMRASRHRDI